MSEDENLVAETATQIFADLADPRAINRGGDGAWKAPLWQALAAAGLTLAWVPQEQGGAGADLADGFAVIGVAGRFAAAVPLVETLLAGWLLARAGISSPDGAMTVAPMHPGDRVTLNSDATLSGRARGISFAREARHLAVCAQDRATASIALVEARTCRIAEGRSLAGDPLDVVTFDGTKPLRVVPAPADLDQMSLMLMGAAARSVQTAGALDFNPQPCFAPRQRARCLRAADRQVSGRAAQPCTARRRGRSRNDRGRLGSGCHRASRHLR